MPESIYILWHQKATSLYIAGRYDNMANTLEMRSEDNYV